MVWFDIRIMLATEIKEISLTGEDWEDGEKYDENISYVKKFNKK